MDREAWNDRYQGKELLWTAEPNGLLVEAVAELEPGVALDLAAGEGRNSVWLATQGWDVTAVDWSDVALDKGRELARRNDVRVWFTQADLRAWWPPPDSADLVIVMYLHVLREERHGVWRAACSALRAGGRLVLVGHDMANLTDGYGGPQSADVLYTTDEAVTVVEECLHVTRAERIERSVETEDGIRVAIDNIVVAVARDS